MVQVSPQQVFPILSRETLDIYYLLYNSEGVKTVNNCEQVLSNGMRLMWMDSTIAFGLFIR